MEIELELANKDSPTLQGDAFTLILNEKNGNRFIPVIIGIAEAKYIIMEYNKIQVKRPLPYDLIMQLLEQNDAEIVKIRVRDVQDGIYFVSVYYRCDEKMWELDARLSDALVLSLKTQIPVVIPAEIFERVCYAETGKSKQRELPAAVRDFWNKSEENDDAEVDFFEVGDGKVPLDLKKATAEQLQELLQEALEKENYELAADIDAELNSRKHE
ncbi:MAG: bifunctional nuclease family protein [Bacteroidales bacterium]|nr:bifunctional nuclease family protein [Bacteroidales bacterium]